MKNEGLAQVPFYYHEAQAARWERSNKRMVGLCAVCVAVAAGCLVCLATLIQKQ